MWIKNKGILGSAVGLAAGLAIGVAVSLQAGPLTPPTTAVSGGIPISTMKTLDQIPPTWDRLLSADDTGDPCNSSRFKCDGVLVRDNQTGVVWTVSPFSAKVGWFTASITCIRTMGTAAGWRLPTIQEFMSLAGLPGLPNGHPFGGVPTTIGSFWTSTTWAADSNQAWVGSLTNHPITDLKLTGLNGVWCVRGGSGPDAQ